MQTKTFDILVRNNNIEVPKIDFLNIDAEGTDYEVLEGFNLSKYKKSINVSYESLSRLQKRRQQRVEP